MEIFNILGCMFIGILFAMSKGNITISINHTYPEPTPAATTPLPVNTKQEEEEVNKEDTYLGMVEALNNYLYPDRKDEN